MDEYNTEKFIKQYEHIKRFQLLKDDELTMLKRKRTQFEVSIKSGNDLKSFVNYIKYELVLMKKFKQIEYEDENQGKALDHSIGLHIKGIFKQALKRFPENKALWSNYLQFIEQKFSSSVTNVYQEMLRFHNTLDDYIVAAEYAMKRKLFFTALTFIIQGISSEWDGNSKLVLLHIECSLRMTEDANEAMQEKTLRQVNKYYEKYLLGKPDVGLYVKLLKQIQDISYSIQFQNKIIAYATEVFVKCSEFWSLMVDRYLDGYFYAEESKKPDEISIETRFMHALPIYEKAVEEITDKSAKQEMIDSWLTKLNELTKLKDIGSACRSSIIFAYVKALESGYQTDVLSEKFFLEYLSILDVTQVKMNEIVEKGLKLFPHSLDVYESILKRLYKSKDFQTISIVFVYAVEHNETKAVQLYMLLCDIYLDNDKKRAIAVMMEAIENSENEKLSAVFQEYTLRYHAAHDGIEKAREFYKSLLSSKKVMMLSLEFLMAVIEIEVAQEDSKHKKIQKCFKQATMFYGADHPQIWLSYIKYNWDRKFFPEADGIRSRAIEAMKGNPEIVQQFELDYTKLWTSCPMEIC